MPIKKLRNKVTNLIEIAEHKTEEGKSDKRTIWEFGIVKEMAVK